MKPTLSADDKPKPAKRGGFKAMRGARRKAYYAARPAFTLANKKRTLARHIRHFPEDAQAIRLCVEHYRDAFANTQISKMTGKAKARDKRRARKAAQISRIKHELAQPTAAHVVPPPAYAPFV